jgi:hypothetical protein
MGHNQDALLDWRKRSDENERRYQVAFQAGTNVLADESTRRGLEGYYETHTNKDGEIIRKVHKYDSRHLELQLKRRDPEAYRDNYVAGGTQPIQIVFHNPFAAVAPEADITLEPVELPQLPAPKEEDDARTTQP